MYNTFYMKLLYLFFLISNFLFNLLIWIYFIAQLILQSLYFIQVKEKCYYLQVPYCVITFIESYNHSETKQIYNDLKTFKQ